MGAAFKYPLIRIHRKTFHQYFQPRFLSRFNPVQRKAVLELLDNLMTSHDKHGSTIGFEGHLRKWVHWSNPH